MSDWLKKLGEADPTLPTNTPSTLSYEKIDFTGFLSQQRIKDFDARVIKTFSL